ncbi:MAG: DUF5103 domain-containing protein [Bacteroidia bacterium]|nr:DUF5103 domain-containing protein [Bacteroidia bacterium]HQV00374.1 DUF5103 domain-containing protein [Bacteroidia bacterium]
MKTKIATIPLWLIPFCFLFLQTAAQNNDYANPNVIRYEDYNYNPNIKTVLLEGATGQLTDAAIELNTNQQLLLRFDHLYADVVDYSYTIIHCDANWQPSQISESQYLQGFSTDKILRYQFATTTLVPYVHYELLFPNDIIKPIISGNYLLRVFKTDTPEINVLTKRFIVFSQLAGIQANIHAGTFADTRFTHHEIDFELNTQQLNLLNPYNDLQVVLLQNGGWLQRIYGLKPRFVNGNKLDYNYDGEYCFAGGNEFRTFDTRSIRFLSERIKQITQADDKTFIVNLHNDIRTSSQRYAFVNDINGQYLIKHQEGRNSDVDADYVWVNFKLKMPQEETEGNMYLYGALTNWRTDTTSLMNYNADDMSYEKSLLLKQGYYNYQYAYISSGSYPDVTVTEGSHYETDNSYTLLIYYRNPNTRYDAIVGYKKLNSIKK